jgi:hypothetical protein
MARVHKLALVIMVSALLGASASPAFATPFTVNLQGQWGYIDFEYLFEPRGGNLDVAWAFDDAIRATGAATSTPGTALHGVFGMSLTFADVADQDPSSNVGYFPGAMTGRLWFGDTTYSIIPTDVWVDAAGSIAFSLSTGFSGPNLTANGYTFRPGYLQFFTLSGPAFASTAVTPAAFTNPAYWSLPHNPMWIGFNGAQELLFANVDVASVTVPEPSTLLSLSGAVLGFAAWRRSRTKAGSGH